MIKSHLIQHAFLIPCAIAALLTFVALFFAMLAWLFRRGARPYYLRAATLPLTDEGGHHEPLS